MLPRTSLPLSEGGLARISAAAGLAFGSSCSASEEALPAPLHPHPKFALLNK